MVQSLFRNATFRAGSGESREYIDYSYLIGIAGDGVSLARWRSHKNLITRTHRHHQANITPDTSNLDCNSPGNVHHACAIYNAVLDEFDSAYEQIIRSSRVANCFLMQILFANPAIIELLLL